MLAVDGKHGLSKREVLKCLEEKRVQFKKLGIDLYATKLIA